MTHQYRTQLSTRQVGTPSERVQQTKSIAASRQSRQHSHRRQSRESLYDYDSDTDADGENCVLSPTQCFSPSKKKGPLSNCKRVHRIGAGAARVFGNKVQNMLTGNHPNIGEQQPEDRDEVHTNIHTNGQHKRNSVKAHSHNESHNDAHTPQQTQAQKVYYSKGWDNGERLHLSSLPSARSVSTSVDGFHDGRSGSRSNTTVNSHTPLASDDATTRQITPIETSAGRSGMPTIQLLDIPSTNARVVTNSNSVVRTRTTSVECPTQTLIAPYVSKLPNHSIVRLVLEAQFNSVEILCSIDVLKMKSEFFHHLFSRPTQNDTQQSSHSLHLLRGGGGERWENSNGEDIENDGSTPLMQPDHPNHDCSDDQQTDCGGSSSRGEVVVVTVKIEEDYTFDAVAYLESLHDGRVLFKGEWNPCWARLSVKWGVQELVAEHATIIDMHVGKLLQKIHAHHWRLNPNALAGYKIALFRKSSAAAPTILLGTIMECSKESSPGTSRLRVMFDDAAHQNGSAAYSRPSIQRICTSTNDTNNSPIPTPMQPDSTLMHMSTISPGPASVSQPHSPNFTNSTGTTSGVIAGYSAGIKPVNSSTDTYTSINGAATTRASTGSTDDGSPQPRSLYRGRDRGSSGMGGVYLPTSAATSTANAAPMHTHSNGNVVGEVMEPFWVRRDTPAGMMPVLGDGLMKQHTGIGASTGTTASDCWQEPDEVFLLEIACKYITSSDIQKFWEMLQCVIDMPELTQFCQCPVVKSPMDIANLLKKPEYQVLWTKGTPDILPKIVVCDILRDKCVMPLTDIKM